MPFKSARSIQKLSQTSLMAAFIAAGALAAIYIGPVPVTFQDFFVCLAGFVLGPKLGPLAVILYILAGSLGLPIFAGGRSGLGQLFGPTGGYFAGFICLAAASGLGSFLINHYAPLQTEQKNSFNSALVIILTASISALIGLCALYCLGTLWLSWRLNIDLRTAFGFGAAPFIPLGIPKMILCSLCYFSLRQRHLVPL